MIRPLPTPSRKTSGFWSCLAKEKLIRWRAIHIYIYIYIYMYIYTYTHTYIYNV
jgi:hypothetical protein